MVIDEMDQFREIWNAAMNTYNKSANDQQIALNFRSLRRFDLADIRRALSAHLNDPDQGRFAPKPADVVRHLTGDPETRAMKAWSKVEEGLTRVSRYDSIVFDEPEIMAAVEDMGGWSKLHECSTDELKFKQNEFIKRYRGYLLHPPQRWPSKFIGIAEASNTITGHAAFIPSPVVIGHEERAALVYQQGRKKKTGARRLDDVLKGLSKDKRLQLGFEGNRDT